MKDLPIILASGSPRRSAILKEAGYAFRVQTADVEEIEEGLSPDELCIENALLKAKTVAGQFPDHLVIGSDTVVCLGERLFGKPANLEEAHEFLTQLSGQTHEVKSGVALICREREIETTFLDSTKVTFRVLTSSLITDYLSRIEPLDKAGGYAIQDHGEMIVESIEGSMHNVVGFPLEEFLLIVGNK